MKSALVLSVCATLLGGCAISPAGYGDRHENYYQDRAYYQDRGSPQERGSDRGNGFGRDYNYRYQYGGQGNQNPFADHGH